MSSMDDSGKINQLKEKRKLEILKILAISYVGNEGVPIDVLNFDFLLRHGAELTQTNIQRYERDHYIHRLKIQFPNFKGEYAFKTITEKPEQFYSII